MRLAEAPIKKQDIEDNITDGMPREDISKTVLAVEKPNPNIKALHLLEGHEFKERWIVVDTAYYNARPDLYEGWLYLEDL